MNDLGEKKALLAVVGVTVLLTAGALYLTYRSYEKAETGKQQIASVRMDIEKARAKKRMIPSLEREVIILRENVEDYVKILPEDKHIHNFINMINRFEQDSSILMTSLDAPTKRGGKKKKGAENAFELALETARAQAARACELRAAIRLASLWQRCGRADDARGQLGETLAEFTDWGDAAEVAEARSLLDSWEEDRSRR